MRHPLNTLLVFSLLDLAQRQARTKKKGGVENGSAAFFPCVYVILVDLAIIYVHSKPCILCKGEKKTNPKLMPKRKRSDETRSRKRTVRDQTRNRMKDELAKGASEWERKWSERSTLLRW